MQPARRGLSIPLLAVGLLTGILGLLYSYLQSIPASLATPLAAAFAVEATLYVLPGLAAARETLEKRFRQAPLALAMTLSGAVPYALYSVPTGVFDWRSCAGALGLAAAVSFWYVLLPRNRAVDVAFVALVAAGMLGPWFGWIYASPVPKLPLAILGQLMWTRLAILEALSIGRMEVHGFGFLPARSEWVAGARNFLLFAPLGAALGWAIGFAGFRLRPLPWWQLAGVTAATFLGMLWVVALREEFFFRGLLQEWLGRWMGSEWGGLLVASVLFGVLHLPFRGFPNWRFALLATLAGFFYGRAYLEARSVRAAMLTHALVNTTWRVFFS